MRLVRLSLILYRLVVLFFYKNRKKGLAGLLFSLLWGGRKHQVWREVVTQLRCHGCPGNVTLYERSGRIEVGFSTPALTKDSILEKSVRDAFPSLTITPPVSRPEHRRKPHNQSRFLRECRATLRFIHRASNFSRPQTNVS